MLFNPIDTRMDEEEFSYKTLRKIQQNEKKSPTLTVIPHLFYSEVLDYIKELQKRAENEDIEKRKTMLLDEISNIEKILKNIYEQREKKIVYAVISKSRGGNPSMKQLLSPELELFECIYKDLQRMRSNIFAKKTSDMPVKKSLKTSNENKVDLVQPKKESCQSIILMTQDIPCFVGTDSRTYHLLKGDVLSIPKEMAIMLKQRKVAEPIVPGAIS